MNLFIIFGNKRNAYFRIKLNLVIKKNNQNFYILYSISRYAIEIQNHCLISYFIFKRLKTAFSICKLIPEYLIFSSPDHKQRTSHQNWIKILHILCENAFFSYSLKDKFFKVRCGVHAYDKLIIIL